MSVSTAVAAPLARSPRRAFALHFGEMLLAMVAGMVVLGGVVAAGLAVAGTSLSAGPAWVSAAVMGFSMTVPMVWWMDRRGHDVRMNAEMAGSMIVPTILAIALSLAGAIAEDSVLLIQHVVMVPAMLGVMLWRYEHYAH